MAKYTSLLVGLVLCFSTFAGSITYHLSTPKPQDHYFQIEMVLEGFKEKELLVKMPVWAPGSYLVREFAKNVNEVKAKDESGNEVQIRKKDKNTWVVAKGKAKKVTLYYEVYAFELTVRTSFLDATHGFVSPSGVFMYVDGYKDQSGEVLITLHPVFSKITTPLTRESNKNLPKDQHLFSYNNYDHLVDSPIEIGNQEIFSFKAAGVEHEVAIYGSGNYDIEYLKMDMAKIVSAATNVFGKNPNEHYTFIIHNVVDGQGGLEHAASTVLSVNRWTYQGAAYKGFLSLVAHEYFHLWNVKRIRPIELGPFNYDEENYTALLWVMEGFTSYYDELLLRRAGYYTEEEYLGKLLNTINYVEGTPGNSVQPVAHASFDAWIKAYRPNENSRNTTISYYSKGSVLAAIIDAMIIDKYQGEKCLDHFLQRLYTTYYEGKKRGFTEKEFQTELEMFLDTDLSEFFSKYINGTEIPDYNAYFSKIGITIQDGSRPTSDSGLSLKTSGGQLIVRDVRRGSAAENAGLSVNDEIIGCNGYRVDQKAFETMLKGSSSGEVLEILFSREQQLYSTDLYIGEYHKPQYIHLISDENKKLFSYWLREDK